MRFFNFFLLVSIGNVSIGNVSIGNEIKIKKQSESLDFGG